MYEIPQSITIGNKEYAIRAKGDYRMVLDCFITLADNELTKQEKLYACLIIFYDNINTIEDIMNLFGDNVNEAIDKMYLFFNCGKEAAPGYKLQYNIIDWEKDELLIVSAINKVANTEIRAVPYLHWWTFMSYYLAIGESPLSTIVGIRNKLAKGKKLEKYERDFKRDNPQYFIWNAKTAEQQEADELARQLWNSGK